MVVNTIISMTYSDVQDNGIGFAFDFTVIA